MENTVIKAAKNCFDAMLPISKTFSKGLLEIRLEIAIQFCIEKRPVRDKRRPEPTPCVEIHNENAEFSYRVEFLRRHRKMVLQDPNHHGVNGQCHPPRLVWIRRLV